MLKPVTFFFAIYWLIVAARRIQSVISLVLIQFAAQTNKNIMANVRTTIDEWEVKDLEDNSSINICVTHNSEMGNNAVPGIQVSCAGNIVNYEPLHVEKWAYAARKANLEEYLIESSSWIIYEDTYIKHFLVTGEVLKAKIAVKVRSKHKEIVKEYELPFIVEN